MPGCAVVRVGAGNNPAGRGTEGPVKRESRTHCARDQSGQLRWVIDIAGRPVEGHLIAGGKRTRRGIGDQAIHGIDNCQFRMHVAMAAAMTDRAIIARCRRLLPFRRMILGNREIRVSVSRLATRHQQDGDHPNDPNVLEAKQHRHWDSVRSEDVSTQNSEKRCSSPRFLRSRPHWKQRAQILLSDARVVARYLAILLAGIAGLVPGWTAFGNVEIPFTHRDGYLWLKVEVAGSGEPLHFLLDSGAAASVVSLDAARRLGLKLGRSVPVEGVHSRTRAFRVNRFDAHVAGVELSRSVLALDLSAVGATCHRLIDGLVGADFFRDRVVQIDYPAGLIRLLDAAPLESGGESLPIKLRNGAICVPISVAGAEQQWLRLDTGCDSAVEWAPGGSPLPFWRGTSVGLTNTRSRTVNADVGIGGHTMRKVAVGVHSRPIFRNESGLLGNILLSKFRVTVDLRKRRVLFEN